MTAPVNEKAHSCGPYRFRVTEEAERRVRSFLGDPKTRHARMVWSPCELAPEGCPCLWAFDDIGQMNEAAFLSWELTREGKSIVAMELELLRRLDGKLLTLDTQPHPKGGTITNFAIR